MSESLLVLLLLLVPQDGATKPTSSITAQEGQAVLLALGSAAKGVGVLTADYVQTQESVLFEKPLVASGKLYLRIEPLTLTMCVDKPEALWIRTDRTSHQVWYRARNRAERFLYKENPLADAMLQCIGGDSKGLETNFDVLEVKREPAGDRVVLVPKTEALRKVIARLELRTTWVDQRLVLESILHSNKDGERTLLELRNCARDPKLEAQDALFTEKLPDEVELLTHDLRTQAVHVAK